MKSNFEDILQKDGVLVYTNVGTSMLPLLRQHKDLLVIRSNHGSRIKWLDAPLYRRPDGKYILHRVLWVCRDSYVICGDNQWRLEFGVKDSQILGILTDVQRDGKTINLYTPKMRLYAYLQFFLFPLRCPLFFVRDKWRGLCRRIRKL